MPSSPLIGPLLIHDGRELRPLSIDRDLRYDPFELLDSAHTGERILYDAEAELLTRVAAVLGKPPRRRADEHESALWLSRDDVAVIGHALERLGRMRARRFAELGKVRGEEEAPDGA